MSTLTTKILPEDLLAMPDGKAFELVRGELVERNVSVLSSRVEGTLFRKLDQHCIANDLGPVLPSSMGIQCFPDDPFKVRRPDVSFVKRARFSADLWKEGFLTIHPDLAAEVISPNDLATEVAEKVEEYLAAGISLVWIIDPVVQTVVIYRQDGTVSKLGKNDELSGEDVIPGFRCPVAELFPK